MKKVKVGIIGAGRIGKLHAENILKSDQLELVAISDINIDHLNSTIYEQLVPLITTNPDLLFNRSEIEGIFICSSTRTHTDFIKRAAKAGKHIFCEKPISFSLKKTEEALQYVREANVKLQVGFNRRFDKHFHKVRTIIQEGKIGDIHLIKISSRDPEPPNENYIKDSGGMFMDMTIHDFDMVRYLSGCEVEEIMVNAANLIDPVFEKYNDVDTAVITLKLENGALAVIDNSRQSVYGYDQRIEVFGNKGSVSTDNIEQTNVKISTKQAIELDHPKYFFTERYKDAFINEINKFARAIIYDLPIECSGEDGFKAQQLAIAAQRSWKEKKRILVSEMTSMKV